MLKEAYKYPHKIFRIPELLNHDDLKYMQDKFHQTVLPTVLIRIILDYMEDARWCSACNKKDNRYNDDISVDECEMCSILLCEDCGLETVLIPCPNAGERDHYCYSNHWTWEKYCPDCLIDFSQDEDVE
jgi:hypothetical protein